MAAGNYRNRCEILKKSTERGEYGERSAELVSFKFVWCDVTEASETEQEQEGREIGVTTYNVKSRYSREIRAGDILRVEGVDHIIEQPSHDFKRRRWTRFKIRTIEGPTDV